MLNATKDGNGKRLASSRREESIDTIGENVDHRRIYKLVKVGDDGSIFAATEDDVFHSLIEGTDNEIFSSNQEVSEAVEDEEEKVGSDFFPLNQDESSIKANTLTIHDLAIERENVKVQIQVLDCILMRLGIDKQKQLSKEKGVESVHFGEQHNSSIDSSIETNRSIEYKRQRRPNPKYFDYNDGNCSLKTQAFISTSRKRMPILSSLQNSLVNTIVGSPRVTSGWGCHRKATRAIASHNSKSIALVLRGPNFNQSLNQAESIDPCVSPIVRKEPLSLDNLSIRELHEAFCSAHGRKTSVKDKHWLKRRILASWMMKGEDLPKSSSQNYNFNSKLDQITQAKQSLLTTTHAKDVNREGANEAHLQGASRVEHFRDAFSKCLENISFQRLIPPSTILSKDNSFRIVTARNLNGSSVALDQTTSYGKVVNSGQLVEGKRKRKPNRRYIEDESCVFTSTFVPIHKTRSCYEEAKYNGLNLTKKYYCKAMKTNDSFHMIKKHGIIKRPILQSISNKKLLSIQRPKFNSISMDGIFGIHREFGERSSNLIHMQFEPPNVVPPLVVDIQREHEESIVTIPTPTSGTRRKHHRPWTLQEVMKLVEGLAHCGGGKWADIKKLAFSTVGYRTSVDLKDKWRNLLRASQSQLCRVNQGERKNQLLGALPIPILARVHELSSLPHQIPSRIFSSSSISRNGRIVHRQ